MPPEQRGSGSSATEPGRVYINLTKADSDTAIEVVAALTEEKKAPAEAVRTLIHEVNDLLKEREVLEEAGIASHLGERLRRALEGVKEQGKPVQPRKHVWTMWTLRWDPTIWDEYIKNVFPKERPGSCDRIVAVRDPIDALRLLSLHARNIRDNPEEFKLFVPAVNPRRPEAYSDLLLSQEFAPNIEMVIIEGEHTDIQFRRPNVPPNTPDLALAHEYRDVVSEGFYKALYDWLAKRRQGELLATEGQLRRWLTQLRTKTSGLIKRHVDPRKVEKIEIYADALTRILDDKLELDRTWWNKTAKDYERCFLETSPDFLRPYFDEQESALWQTFDNLTHDGNQGHDVAFIELGCGTGRVLAKFASRFGTSRLSAVVGVDFSHNMVGESAETLGAVENGGRDCPFALYEGAAESFDKLCSRGSLLADPDKKHRRHLDKVKKAVKENRCLVSIMDILPNTHEDRRKNVLKGVVNSLKSGDMLFVSSYDGVHFANEAYKLYTHKLVQEIAGKSVILYDIGNRDFASLDDTVGGGRLFFSHWLAESELRDLLTIERLAKPERVLVRAGGTGQLGLFLTARVK